MSLRASFAEGKTLLISARREVAEKDRVRTALGLRVSVLLLELAIHIDMKEPTLEAFRAKARRVLNRKAAEGIL
jgi:hypothetical protein